jgi:Icc-related predicted phosphoesterase
MKIALASDLHLEFATISLENTENADVLILSGDICVEKYLLERDTYETRFNDKSSRIHKFFEECCARFPAVIYIMGNHEHYNGDYSHTIGNIRSRLAYLSNLHVLDKQVLKIGDVTFIGGTLWTDMNKEDPKTLYGIRGYMNDYRIIQNSNRVAHFKDEDGKTHTRTAMFMPEDSVEDHKAMLKFIAEVVGGNVNDKFVVVGHHAPSKLSTKPRYEKDVMVNGAYSSDLSEFILDRTQIKLWTHGHTHDNFDYMVGDTRIVCNPRGYEGYEKQADNFELKFMEI